MKKFLSFIIVGMLLSTSNVMLNVKASSDGVNFEEESESDRINADPYKELFNRTDCINIYAKTRDELLEDAEKLGEKRDDLRPVFVIRADEDQDDFNMNLCICIKASEDDLAYEMDDYNVGGIDYTNWDISDGDEKLIEGKEDFDSMRSLCLQLIDICNSEEEDLDCDIDLDNCENEEIKCILNQILEKLRSSLTKQ